MAQNTCSSYQLSQLKSLGWIPRAPDMTLSSYAPPPFSLLLICRWGLCAFHFCLRPLARASDCSGKRHSQLSSSHVLSRKLEFTRALSSWREDIHFATTHGKAEQETSTESQEMLAVLSYFTSREGCLAYALSSHCSLQQEWKEKSEIHNCDFWKMRSQAHYF